MKILTLIFCTILLPSISLAETKMITKPSGNSVKPQTKVIKSINDAKEFRKKEGLGDDMRARPTYELLNEDRIVARKEIRNIYVAHGDKVEVKTEKITIR